MTLSYKQRVFVQPDTLINVISGESVLLNLKHEQYFGLDEVGTDMWHALTSSDSIQTAYARLLEEFEVDPALLKHDLDEFVARLLANSLIELSE